jgi:hypothetical protein
VVAQRGGAHVRKVHGLAGTQQDGRWQLQLAPARHKVSTDAPALKRPVLQRAVQVQRVMARHVVAGALAAARQLLRCCCCVCRVARPCLC